MNRPYFQSPRTDFPKFGTSIETHLRNYSRFEFTERFYDVDRWEVGFGPSQIVFHNEKNVSRGKERQEDSKRRASTRSGLQM